jgi:hypothetical protein
LRRGGLHCFREEELLRDSVVLSITSLSRAEEDDDEDEEAEQQQEETRRKKKKKKGGGRKGSTLNFLDLQSRITCRSRSTWRSISFPCALKMLSMLQFERKARTL